MLSGTEERKRVVMGCRSRDEQRYIKLSLSRLTCRGHRSGDLTGAVTETSRALGWEGRKETMHVYMSDAEALSFWNLSFIPIVCLLLFSLNSDMFVCTGETLTLFSPSIFLF